MQKLCLGIKITTQGNYVALIIICHEHQNKLKYIHWWKVQIPYKPDLLGFRLATAKVASTKTQNAGFLSPRQRISPFCGLRAKGFENLAGLHVWPYNVLHNVDKTLKPLTTAATIGLAPAGGAPPGGGGTPAFGGGVPPAGGGVVAPAAGGAVVGSAALPLSPPAASARQW